MELESLKQKRTSLRSNFTKISKRLETLIQTPDVDKELIEINLEQLCEKVNQLRAVDEKFLETLQKGKCSQQEYDTEFDAAEEYSEKFLTLKVKSKNILNVAVPSPRIETKESAVSTSYRLPEIELKKYDGNPRQWLAFWNQFKNIHDNEKIDDLTKFQYLIQSTEPNSKPREIVESFPVTSANYNKAVQYLQQRFGRENVLIQVYIRDLLQLVINNKKDNDLASLYDKLQTQLSALESLGLTQDKYADFLFPLVESALPSDFIRVWDRNRFLNQEDTGKTDLQSLIEFLKTEVESLERLSLARDTFPEKGKKVTVKKSNINNTVCTASELFISNKFTNSDVHSSKKCDLCIFCEKAHASENCNVVSDMTLDAKKNIIKKKNACFVCLKRNHRANSCKSKHRCLICKNRHFIILCPDLPVKIVKDEVKENKTNSLNNCTQFSDVLLQTLIVKLYNGDSELLVRAIYDSGSMKSYICNDVAELLKFKVLNNVKLKQSLFGGLETEEKEHVNYLVELSSLDKTYKCNFEALSHCICTFRICSNIKQIPPGNFLKECKKHNIKLSDLERSSLNVDPEIKLLIGVDVAGKLMTGKIICLESGPVAIQTHLGWTLMGKIPNMQIDKSQNYLSVSSLLVRDVADLWKLDVLGITDPVETKSKSELHNEALEYFEATLNVDSEGRYEVALPWVLDSSVLPTNRDLAEKCLHATEKKLVNSDMKEIYSSIFKEWQSNKIIEQCNSIPHNGTHYLPHRPVIKESSETTKVRPVFNASARCKNSLSLNQCLTEGPNLIEIIPSILNRFRKHRVGISSDIEKAFLQIGVREKDRDFLRFLWLDECNKIKIYRHRRVVFGLTSSPFLLAATLNYHLSRVPEELSKTAKILRESFYVDNSVTSLASKEEVEKFIIEARLVMASGNFNLRCWQSNMPNRVILNENEKSETVPVLGLIWNKKNDTLSCKIEPLSDNFTHPTKRQVLSVAQKIFDPIGFTCPVTLVPKLILQETWKTKLKWDEELPTTLAKQFQRWVKQLPLLAEICIPRWLNILSEDHEISFHVFCDASKISYATCVYVRVETPSGITVQLVCARNRVAPLKSMTIPRLELLSCLIGARLASSVISDLKLFDSPVVYWSDSTTALGWIRREEMWGTFVYNRVKEIRSLTNPSSWRHISGSLNPADLISRGCSAEKLLERRWWEGPDWLHKDESDWIKSKENPDENLINAELRKTVVINLSKNVVDNWYYKYFSSFKRIVCMLAWILRFYFNCKKIDCIYSKNLSVSELERAERTLLLLIQKDSFKGPTDDKLKNLRPFVDCYGLIRARTNVSFRDDTHDFKHPVILPSEHPVVHLLILEKHKELLHSGVTLLMSHLREHFWIPKSRKTIRRVIQKCINCKRFDARKCEAEPCPPPEDRVRDALVFEVVGIDLAGPLCLKGGQKAWIVLFTCAVYRAVHLELVTSLSTEAFIQSLRRFISRRGNPRVIYSDNGKNFIGAHRALSRIDWNAVLTVATCRKIEWKFNPPSAAWWGEVNTQHLISA